MYVIQECTLFETRAQVVKKAQRGNTGKWCLSRETESVAGARLELLAVPKSFFQWVSMHLARF